MGCPPVVMGPIALYQAKRVFRLLSIEKRHRKLWQFHKAERARHYVEHATEIFRRAMVLGL
jgi:RNase P subunit RPR2